MLDRVRIEVIRNALRLAAEEMGTAVVCASFSSIIQEMAEASACVLTADGRLVHGPRPVHSSSLRLGLRAIVEDFRSTRWSRAMCTSPTTRTAVASTPTTCW